MPGGTGGEYEGVRYFDCEGHGLFLPVELVSKDDRFNSQRSRSVGSTPASSSVPEPLLRGINLKAMGGVFETSECKFAIHSTVITSFSIPHF